MERIEGKIMENQTWMNDDQVWKLDDCEKSSLDEWKLSLEKKDWVESNMDEWKIKFNN